MKYFAILLALVLQITCGDAGSEIIETGVDGLPINYSYVVQFTCFCSTEYIGPHYIKIENGMITDYDHRGPRLFHAITEETKATLALPQLLDRVAELVAQNPFEQTIEYHPDYNFVSKAYFDLDRRIADEEWGYEIWDFEAL